MLQVRKRNGFSDRNGIKRENIEIQYTNLDERTRVTLLNFIHKAYGLFFDGWGDYNSKPQQFMKYILREVYIQVINENTSVSPEYFFDIIKQTILMDEYSSVLTLFEIIIGYFSSEINMMFELANQVFRSEYVGYRFVNEKIVPITDDNEIKAVNEAVDGPYEAVNKHIDKAICLLADRQNPDYENSIKESISAVEAMCEHLTEIGKDATLGKMLKKLEDKGIVIHSAMKSAFEKLYGYTSDASGIRHAGDIGGKSSTFEEAKFMLVSCCAFVNYLNGVSAN